MTTQNTTKLILKFGVGLAFIAAGIWLFRRVSLPDCATIHSYLARQGNWAPLVYVVGSVIVSLFLFPRTLLLISAGMVFGFGWGVFWVMLSSMISAVATFWISRRLVSQRVLAFAGSHPELRKTVDNFDRNEFSYMMFLRLAHVSFGAVNYICGALPVRFGVYFWTTLIGLLPATVAVVYAASGFGCALVDGDAALPPDLKWKLWASGIGLSLMALLPIFFRRKSSGPGQKTRPN